jgi:predicted nucleotidyltransferase
MSDERLPERPLDVMRLLETLARHGVDFTVVGGVAVQVHGHRRTTRDLDVIPEPSRANLERLTAALEELNARPTEIPGAGPPTVEQLATAAIVPPLTTDHGELHVLNEVPGAAPYAELRSRALVIALDGVDVPIVALDDLLAMKRATGRPDDLRDVEVLGG